MTAPEERPVEAPKPASPSAARGGRRRGGAARSGGRSRGRGGLIVFLLVSAVPAAAIGWYVMQPKATQDRLIELFDGSGGRAAKAGICLVALIALARLALPAFHASSNRLREVMGRIRAKPAGVRVLLFPLELVVWLLWFLVQILFAVDAVLILATGALVIILVIRIVDPSVLADVLPPILS